ncbi:helix-turn-helix domain-containing protein [Streptomyces sp. NA02950]|nr:helix-turn-helix domain-containing protein [Streptomyces sp. NA02950]
MELLASRAPADHFESLVARARAAGASGAELAALERSRRLGLHLHMERERWRQREASLTALIETARDLARAGDLDTLLHLVTRRARHLLGADLSFVSLRVGREDRLRVTASDGHTSRRNLGLELPDSGGLANGVLASASPLWTADYLADGRFPHNDRLDAVVRDEGVCALMAVPLGPGEDPVGILYVSDRTVRHFSADELSLMSSLAELAAAAVETVAQLERGAADVAALEQADSRRGAELRRLSELTDLHDRLIGQVLGGGGLQAVAEEAGRGLGCPLGVYGPDGTVLAAGEEPATDGTAVTVATMDAYASRGPTELDNGAWATPLLAGEEHLGTLLAYPDRPFTDHGRRLLGGAARAMAAGLLVQRGRAVDVGEQQACDELLDDLLAGTKRSARQLGKRACRLGVNLDDPHVVVVACPEGETHGREVVWADLYVHRVGGIKSAHDGRTVLLLPGTDPSAVARAVLKELAPLLKDVVTVSAAGPVPDAGAVHHAYLEARRCLSAMTALGLTGRAAAAGELGFLGLLLSGNHDVEGFIESTVRPVIDYDRQHFTDLTRTLEVYFSAGTSPTQTAKMLYVHPNTVARRLRRISELLGPEWQQPDRALEIQVALRLSRMRHALRDDKREVLSPAWAPQGQGA